MVSLQKLFNMPNRLYFKKRFRYIVARWGYSQHLMSYDLWNEVDLVEGPNAREIAAWHQELGAYLRSIDPWKHIVCSHVCLHGSAVTQQFWQVPEVEYIQADEYWGKTRAEGMNKFFDKNARYRHKPMFFIEYGPQTAALPVPFSEWQRDFRVGQWVGNTMPMGAVPVFWYHDAWEKYKLYGYQKGLMAYNEGEERRGLDLRKATVAAAPAEQVGAQFGDFDLLCHIAYDQPPLTRKERANNVKKRDYFTKYGDQARAVLEALLDKYADEGITSIENAKVFGQP